MATKTKKTVDEMSAKDRLWDSLDYSYGEQQKASDKSFDKARSQADRQAMSRGMQRSSYNSQILANIDKAKIDAQNQIQGAKIADYENRLNTMEQQEKEDERWERQFAANEEQNAWQRAFQERQANTAENQWNAQFGETKAQNEWQRGITERQLASTEEQNAWQRDLTERQYKDQKDQTKWQQGFQERQAATAENQWNAQFGETQAQNTWQRNMQERQLAANEEQNAWQRDLTERQYRDQKDQTKWQQNMQERQYADTRSDTMWQRAFQEQQAAASNTQWQASFGLQERQLAMQEQQWREQFNYEKMSNDQKIAYNYVTAAAEKGGDVSDDLLARAGLSRSDYTAMKKKVSASAGKSSTKKPWEQMGITEEQYNKMMNAPSDASFNNDLYGLGTGITEETPYNMITDLSNVLLSGIYDDRSWAYEDEEKNKRGD